MTETVVVKDWEKPCSARVKDMWYARKIDLSDPKWTDWLGFDYVEPGTWEDQLEGYYRWQFSWGGPSDELRAYVNLNKSIHRLEYWFMDWHDGAKVEVNKDEEAWQRTQEMIEMTSGN